MEKAIIKANGLYYGTKSSTGAIEWKYLKEEAQVIVGFENIRETITSITESLEGDKMNIELVNPDEYKKEHLLTGELHGADILQ